MDYPPSISSMASLLADPGRVAMVWALMDGSARPAGELALLAGLSASSASAHLARLHEGGVLALQARGRSRYYRLASAEIGVAVEALASAALASQEQRPRAIPLSRTTPLALRQARTCYDHLAGELAVGLYQRMLASGWIAEQAQGLQVTPLGAQALSQLGIELTVLRKLRRQLACACPDWSERKPHMGGALGAALLQHGLQAGWLHKNKGSRALRVSPAGQQALLRLAAPAD